MCAVAGASEGQLAAVRSYACTATAVAPKGADATAQCPICLAAFETGDTLSCLPCGHEHHRACLVEWLHLSACCPMCKRECDADDAASDQTGEHLGSAGEAVAATAPGVGAQGCDLRMPAPAAGSAHDERAWEGELASELAARDEAEQCPDRSDLDVDLGCISEPERLARVEGRPQLHQLADADDERSHTHRDSSADETRQRVAAERSPSAAPACGVEGMLGARHATDTAAPVVPCTRGPGEERFAITGASCTSHGSGLNGLRSCSEGHELQ